MLPLSLLLLLALVVFTLPRQVATVADSSASSQAVVGMETIQPIIQQHCTNCHAEQPSFAGFAAPPLGVVLETTKQIEAEAQRIYQTVVVSQVMPLGNMQQMTQAQRDLVGQWYAGQAATGEAKP